MARLRRVRPSRVAAISELSGERSLDEVFGVAAASLAEARRQLLPVVDTWALASSAFRDTVRSELPPAHDPASLIRVIHRPRGRERAARAFERLHAVELDPAVEHELDDLWESLEGAAHTGVRVSTSPTVSDGGLAEAAALTRSALRVQSRAALGKVVRALWATAFHEHALGYLRTRRVRDVAIGLLFQPIGHVQATAVVVTNDRLVLFHDGLGGLDDRNPQPAQWVRLDGDGELIGRVGAAQAPVPLWAREQLAALCAAVDPIGAFELRVALSRSETLEVFACRRLPGFGYPADGNSATRWARLEGDEAGWEALTALSRDLSDDLGAERMRSAYAALRHRMPREGSAATRIHGRAYVDLTALFEESSTRPEEEVRRVTALIGAQLGPDADGASSARRSLAKLGLTVAQLRTERRRLADEVERFDREAQQRRQWLAEMDLAILPDDSLQTTLGEGYEFYAHAMRLVIECTRAFGTAHGLLTAIVSRHTSERASAVVHAITAGASDLETAKPAVAFGHVVGIARRDPAFSSMVDSVAGVPIDDLPQGSTRRALGQFLEAYGDRCPGEVELALPRWFEDSRPLTLLLSRAVLGDGLDPDSVLSGARAVADSRLAELERMCFFVEARLLREAISEYRAVARLVARARVRLGHALTMLRTMALDADRRLRRHDPSLFVGASLHMTLSELTYAVARSPADLGSIARLRRVEHGTLARRAHPAVLFTGAIPPAHRLPSELGPLRGHPASPGCIEAVARRLGPRLSGLAHFVPGDVLVVPSLDVALGPVMLLSSAIVSELGNPLSAGAVLARELGVPAVSGVEGALDVILDGARVRVDGDQGTVTLVP